MADNWDSNINNNFETNVDIELLKKEIGQRFPYYDVQIGLNKATFFCRIDENTLEENFENLRLSLSEKGYIPMLRFEQGEHKIYVLKKTKRKEKPVWINFVLLIATIITTIITGAILNTCMGSGILQISNFPVYIIAPVIIVVIIVSINKTKIIHTGFSFRFFDLLSHLRQGNPTSSVVLFQLSSLFSCQQTYL